MFNVPLKLREAKELIIPEGPNFASAPLIKCEIDGTKISFKAPKHKPRRANHKGLSPEAIYRENDLPFRDYYDEEKEIRGLTDNWREADIFYHAWAFNGPWFTGVASELRCAVRIIKIVNYPDAISLFHPRSLEKVIGDNLTNLYSGHISETNGGIQIFNAPTNWQPLHHLPVVAVKLQSQSLEFSAFPTIEHLVYFPIADNLFIRIMFWPSRLKNLSRSELDKLVSEKPMLELMDNIIESIQLELSSSAQAQQQAALKDMEDTSLIKEYPPLKWDKVSEAEKLKILTAQS
ncbi:hypothetical protein P886_1237 [Alteromonadaceae bacterium 2753L.S.0a.02]|nr:hypothetical protein P886_1237 [Alteromonadaceae bacterium 2753L.S.0a.02]